MKVQVKPRVHFAVTVRIHERIGRIGITKSPVCRTSIPQNHVGLMASDFPEEVTCKRCKLWEKMGNRRLKERVG